MPTVLSIAITALDENVLAELLKFKQALIRFYASQKKAVLFIEKTSAPKSSGRTLHTVIHCYAVSPEVEADAPLYFKQALLDIARHAGRRLA